MVKLIVLWLVGCALCVTPVAAAEDVYDGPTAIRPPTVTPQPQSAARPGAVCDFEHRATRRRAGPGSRLLWLPQSWLPRPPLPDPKSPMNPSS